MTESSHSFPSVRRIILLKVQVRDSLSIPSEMGIHTFALILVPLILAVRCSPFQPAMERRHADAVTDPGAVFNVPNASIRRALAQLGLPALDHEFREVGHLDVYRLVSGSSWGSVSICVKSHQVAQNGDEARKHATISLKRAYGQQSATEVTAELSGDELQKFLRTMNKANWKRFDVMEETDSRKKLVLDGASLLVEKLVNGTYIGAAHFSGAKAELGADFAAVKGAFFEAAQNTGLLDVPGQR